MKKSVKYFSVALAAMALASCSSDDLLGGSSLSSKYKKTLTVEVVPPVSDELQTRVAMNSKNDLSWQGTDIVRAYDKDLHVYDEYEFDLATRNFGLKEEAKADLKDGEAAYMLSPYNAISYGGWKKGVGLYAVMKIDSELKYSEDTYLNDGVTPAYVTHVPIFGTIEDDGTGQLKGNSKYLTGALKIELANGNKNASAIRVTSLDAEGNPNEAMPLAGYFDAVFDTDTPLSELEGAYPKNDSKLQKSAENILDKEYTTSITVNTENLPSYTSIVYVPIVEGTYPCLRVEYLKANGDKENDEDWVLIADLKGNDGTGKVIQAHHIYANKDKEGDKAAEPMKVTFAIEVVAEGFSKLNEVIREYAEMGIAVEIKNTATLTAKENDHTLRIPDNAPAITVNLAEGYSCQPEAGGTKYDMIVVGGKDTKPFTLHIEKRCNATNLDFTDVECDINLEATSSIILPTVKTSKSESTTHTQSGGRALYKDDKKTQKDGANTKLIGQGAAVVIAESGIVGTVTNTANDITVLGTVENLNNNKGAGDVTVKGGYVENLVNDGGNIKFIGGGFNKLDNNGGEIELTEMKAPNASNLTNNTDNKLTISGAEDNTSYNIWQVVSNGDGQIDINKIKIHTLTINSTEKASEIAVNATDLMLGFEDYANGGLVYNAGKKDAPVKFQSEGNTWIQNVKVKNAGEKETEQTYADHMTNYRDVNNKDVTKLLVEFKSEWDGKSKAEKTVGATYEVYTAAELAALLDYSKQTETNNTVNLYADINLNGNNNAVWTGINAFEKATTLNGNDKTISNVTIGNTETSKNLSNGQQAHYGFGFINVAKAALTVKDLNLESVNTNGLKLWNDLKDGLVGKEGFSNQISAVGGLVGWQKGNGTYNNVTVQATTLGLAGSSGNRPFGNTYSTDNVKVGGLVGMTANVAGMQTSVEKCTVNVSDQITGQWALGGLIGCVDVAANDKSNKVTLKNNKVTVAKFNPTLHIEGKDKDEELSDYYGTVGMLIGCITDADRGNIATELSITQEAGYTITDCIVGNRADLGFIKNARTVNNEYEVFNGYEIANSIYVGYSWSNNTGKVTLKINGWTAPNTPVVNEVNDLNVFIKKKRNDTNNYANKR